MKRYRFAYLLASLLLVLFVRPFVTEQVLGVAFIDIMLMLTLVIGAYTAIEHRVQLVIGIIIMVLMIGSWIMWSTSERDIYLIGYFVSSLAGYGGVTWFLLRSLFANDQKQRITHDTLYKAVSIYLLFGLIWVFAYALLELLAPGSFTFGQQRIDDESHFKRFVGFSFTTLTTLGYGNISPATPRADAMTTLQAITGQIYLVIVIARLVALQIMQQDKKPS